MPQVIIVSNRLPVSVKKIDGELVFSESAGGLPTALSAYTADPKSRWIGWPGIASDELTPKDRVRITAELAERHCQPVFLTQREIDLFYNGFSNSVLWPLLHGLPLEAGARNLAQWRGYQRVNQRYADAILVTGSTDLGRIWIHDYQLMLVPALIRKARPDLHTGFFLHTPFPQAKKFAKLAEHKQLLKSLLAADLIGLQTPTYVQNFLESCHLLDLDINNDLVSFEERTVKVTDFPISIDYARFARARKQPAVRKASKQYRRKYRGLKIIAATERLDISKGFEERLKAYQIFLRQTPKLREKIVFVLVGAPSRTDIPAYRLLAQRVQRHVKAINAEFGTDSWKPVEYISEVLPFHQVAALLGLTDVAFVTPLKDGMNLVPKEFLASRRKPGVLVLSRTAGAAEELSQAILVDPHRPETLVEGLQQAFGMTRWERRRRFRQLKRQVATHTVDHWKQSFMNAFQQSARVASPFTRYLNKALEREIVATYRQAENRLLLLDYDGTLRPFTNDPDAAKPSPRLQLLLAHLAADPRNTVVIISGRRPSNLDDWFSGLGLHFVAEHGAFYRERGRKVWQQSQSTKAAKNWQAIVYPILKQYADLTPGASIEQKETALVWHYRTARSYYAQKNLVILKRLLQPLEHKLGISVHQGHMILEITPGDIDKGAISQRWLATKPGFVLAIGDDYTDEELFAMLPEQAYSIKVGLGRSRARYRVASPARVRALLRLLG